MWKKLNTVLKVNATPEKITKLEINGQELSGTLLVDAFNKHFVSVANIPVGRHSLNSLPYIKNTIFLNPVNELGSNLYNSPPK